MYIDPTGHWFIAAIVAIVKAVATFAATHPVIFAGMVSSTANVAFNSQSIHNVGDFLKFASIGYAGGAVGAGVGIGAFGALGGAGALGPFWGGLASSAVGGFTGGFVGGAGNNLAYGIGFREAVAVGVRNAAIAAAVSTVTFIAGYGICKAINAMRAAKAAQNATGVDIPEGQQTNTPKKSLETTNSKLKVNNDVEGYPQSFDPISEGETTGTRYVGPGEAAEAAKTGMVPNTTAKGEIKNIFYTPEESLSSASQAQSVYNLPNTPTHSITVDTTKVTNIYGGNVEGGSGIELITKERLRVINIKKLGE